VPLLCAAARHRTGCGAQRQQIKNAKKLFGALANLVALTVVLAQDAKVRLEELPPDGSGNGQRLLVGAVGKFAVLGHLEAALPGGAHGSRQHRGTHAVATG